MPQKLRNVNEAQSEYLEAVSGDGVRLCVRVTGPPDGFPILFLHGFTQSHLAWRRQFEGPLARRFRLIAFDLRGHGWSDKPQDASAYGEPHRWAGDVAAVLAAAAAERAVFVGWSYGGRVILDYAATLGTAAIAGINFVAAVVGDAGEYYGERIGTIRGTLASDPAANIDGTRRFLRACFERQPAEDDFERMLAYNAMVPPAIRAKLLKRKVDGHAVLASLASPALFTQGTRDAIIGRAMCEYGVKTVPGATLSLYEGIGHSPFWEDAERFDRELTDFVRICVA